MLRTKKFLLLFTVLVAIFATGPSQAAVAETTSTAPLFTYDLTEVQKYDITTQTGKNNIWAECHVVAALQGLVNRDYPRLYIYFNTDNATPGHLDIFWMNIMQQPGGWLAGRKLQPVDNFTHLVKKFRSAYKGVVLYDLSVPATSHVASTVAGCDDLLPIPYDTTPGSVYERLVVNGPKLPIVVRLINPDGSPMFTGAVTGSAKCDAYMWAKQNYLDTGKCDPTILGYYIDAYWLKVPENSVQWDELCSADYLIQHKAFFFDLSPWSDEAPIDDPNQPIGTDFNTMCAILLSAYNQTKGKEMISISGFPPIGWEYEVNHGGSHGDVATEWQVASIISCYNTFLDSADTPMANASVYCKFPLQDKYTQTKPTLADWKKAGYVDSNGKVVPYSYVTLYGGDYDAAAWMYQFLPQIWSDPARGTVPVGWGFNPNLAVRFPVGIDWIRNTATPTDLFVCGDSAAGYLNPGNLDGSRPFSGLPSGVETWKNFCAHWYDKFDLSLSGFVIDGISGTMSAQTAQAYATFSHDGVIDEYTPQQPAWLAGTTNVPSIWMEAYFSPPTDVSTYVSEGEGLVGNDSAGTPHFHAWRTILWTPTELQQLMQGLEQGAPNAKVVDPYTMMGLEKLSLQQSGS